MERPDILHIHGIGPAFFTPLGRMLGLNVVVTHHMANYENEKWNGFARSILRFGERVGMRLSQGRIAVSPSLAERMCENVSRERRDDSQWHRSPAEDRAGIHPAVVRP